jgi:benzil reductase ((S)-benzoin forming)
MRQVFITGSSSGIGKAIAELLLEENDNKLVGISRSNTIAEHANYKHIHFDLSDLEKLYDFEFEVDNNCESIVLINNSGQVEPVAHLGHDQDREISANYSLNLIAPSILTNKFLATFKKSGKNLHIINVSSGAGKYPIDGWSTYNASKAGLDMFSKVLKEELEIDGYQNIHIHSIAPGIVDTKMQELIRSNKQDDFSNIERFLDYHKNGDLADPYDVAHKYIQVIKTPEDFKEVVISVKDF